MNKKNFALGLATLALSIAHASTAQAVAINGVTVTSTLTTSSGNLNNIINDTGLTVPGSLTSTHASTGSSNAYTGRLTSLTDSITFNLQGNYSLAGFSLWARQLFTTLRTANIQSSTDGTNFTNIGSSPFQFTTFTNAPIAAQQIVFTSPVTAAFIRFLPLTNFSTNNSGVLNTTTNNTVSLAEVKFNGSVATSVPEPVTIFGTIMGLGGGAALKRRLKAIKSKSV